MSSTVVWKPVDIFAYVGGAVSRAVTHATHAGLIGKLYVRTACSRPIKSHDAVFYHYGVDAVTCKRCLKRIARKASR